DHRRQNDAHSRRHLPAGCRLGDEGCDDSAARHRCPGDGDLATGKTRCAPASLRPWQPLHQRAIPDADGRARRRELDLATWYWYFWSIYSIGTFGAYTLLVLLDHIPIVRKLSISRAKTQAPISIQNDSGVAQGRVVWPAAG